jgi:hypothetical protein
MAKIVQRSSYQKFSAALPLAIFRKTLRSAAEFFYKPTKFESSTASHFEIGSVSEEHMWGYNENPLCRFLKGLQLKYEREI